uniref:Uncharacterized protein n=1 Tax=Klebsiella pneumoniae subsp. pneumoniae TaxID=72407 RepID=E5F8Z3_KLEPN|nr:unknown [Klebsiella pneumoniae subsp. pneumoniae]
MRRAGEAGKALYATGNVRQLQKIGIIIVAQFIRSCDQFTFGIKIRMLLFLYL